MGRRKSYVRWRYQISGTSFGGGHREKEFSQGRGGEGALGHPSKVFVRSTLVRYPIILGFDVSKVPRMADTYLPWMESWSNCYGPSIHFFHPR